MGINEPIPGAVPEPVGAPEKPKGGLKVEVYQSDIIHKLAIDLGRSTKNLADLHNTDLNDSLVRTASTTLWSWGEQRGINTTLRVGSISLTVLGKDQTTGIMVAKELQRFKKCSKQRISLLGTSKEHQFLECH